MKTYTEALLLLSSWLVLFGRSVYAEDSQIENYQQRDIEQASNFDLLQNFREPKKILFSCLFGGSSHNHWVISILNELNQRGHSITYITKDDQVKFSSNYPNMETISIGKTTTENKEKVWKAFRTETSLDSKAWGTANVVSIKTLKEDYLQLLERMKTGKYEVVICDLFNDPCHLASYQLNIPTILTASLAVTNDVSAPYINIDAVGTNVPTTQYMTLWERIRDKVINKVRFIWKIRKLISEQTELFKELGINLSLDPEDRWKHCVKMINTAFGIQQGRPIGPLVEFIGPILKTKVPKLTSELAHYLDSHQRVAYIAFGQLAAMTKNDATLILSGLIEAYENKEIDGFIWATRGLETALPELIVSQSNTTYNVSYLLEDPSRSTDFVFPKWAPQMAILNHPSTSLFITHGGSASLYESLYSGTRMVIYPFFIDQPFAAATAEKNGYGLKLTSTASRLEAIDIIRKVARDQNNTFQKNANRFQALIQIRSKHGIIKGADLVEEVLFLNENGKITHRKDVKDDLSFFKANNLDVYMVLISSIVLTLYVITRFVIFVSTMAYKLLKTQPKPKTL